MKAYLDQNIQSHRVWNESHFSSAHALLDLVLMASETDTEVLFRGHYYQIQRGQKITSDNLLANHWGWSRNKVRSFLLQLDHESLISLDRNKRRTIITIENTAKCGIIITTEETIEKPEKVSIKEQVIKQEKGYLNTTPTEGLSSVEVQVKELVTGYVKEQRKRKKGILRNLFSDTIDAKYVGNPEPNYEMNTTVPINIFLTSRNCGVKPEQIELDRNYKLAL